MNAYQTPGQPPAMDPVDRMLNVFENADPKVLARIDERISEKRELIAKYTNEMNAEIARLKRMRIAMAKTLGLTAPAKRKKANGDTTPAAGSFAARIVEHLTGDGPVHVNDIARDLGEKPQAIRMTAIKSPALKYANNEVSLA